MLLHILGGMKMLWNEMIEQIQDSTRIRNMAMKAYTASLSCIRYDYYLQCSIFLVRLIVYPSNPAFADVSTYFGWYANAMERNGRANTR